MRIRNADGEGRKGGAEISTAWFEIVTSWKITDLGSGFFGKGWGRGEVCGRLVWRGWGDSVGEGDECECEGVRKGGKGGKGYLSTR